jgi:transcriptional regulator with XRE-family HTH domain
MSIAVMAKPRRIWTEADRVAAANLSKIWKEKAARLGLTQEKAAAALGEPGEGITQGAVSQYLRGVIPCRAVATFRFAKLLHVRPMEIRPDLADLTGELDPETFDFAQEFQRLSPEERAKWRALNLLSSAAESTKPEQAATRAKKTKRRRTKENT